MARQTAIPFAATRRSRSPAGARLAALSRIAFALIAMAFCPKKIAILSLDENGTNQFASANRPKPGIWDSETGTNMERRKELAASSIERPVPASQSLPIESINR